MARYHTPCWYPLVHCKHPSPLMLGLLSCAKSWFVQVNLTAKHLCKTKSQVTSPLIKLMMQPTIGVNHPTQYKGKQYPWVSKLPNTLREMDDCQLQCVCWWRRSLIRCWSSHHHPHHWVHWLGQLPTYSCKVNSKLHVYQEPCDLNIAIHPDYCVPCTGQFDAIHPAAPMHQHSPNVDELHMNYLSQPNLQNSMVPYVFMWS